MALLQLVSEESMEEESVHEYFEDLYKIICVSERPTAEGRQGGAVRSTYVVDWEQLVHLLEDYTYFGEDIVEVKAISGDEGRVLRRAMNGSPRIARA